MKLDWRRQRIINEEESKADGRNGLIDRQMKEIDSEIDKYSMKKDKLQN